MRSWRCTSVQPGVGGVVGPTAADGATHAALAPSRLVGGWAGARARALAGWTSVGYRGKAAPVGINGVAKSGGLPKRGEVAAQPLAGSARRGGEGGAACTRQRSTSRVSHTDAAGERVGRLLGEAVFSSALSACWADVPPASAVVRVGVAKSAGIASGSALTRMGTGGICAARAR